MILAVAIAEGHRQDVHQQNRQPVERYTDGALRPRDEGAPLFVSG
jgi:hypothetical protein